MNTADMLKVMTHLRKDSVVKVSCPLPTLLFESRRVRQVFRLTMLNKQRARTLKKLCISLGSA